MSNGIMEKNLPVAESLGSGDKVRIVTAAGNSKQIDASQMGGGIFKVTTNYTFAEEETPTLDKTFNEIKSAFDSGKEIMVIETDEESDGVYLYILNDFFISSSNKYVVLVSDPQADTFEESKLRFESNSPDGVLMLIHNPS